MSPALKVIEGGRAELGGAAPRVPSAIVGERLYPILAPLGRRGAFFVVVAVSLVLHGAVLLASVDWDILGEERVAGGSDDVVVVEGIDVILIDQMPSAPLTEAQTVEESDAAEMTSPTEARAIAADRRADQVPVDRARPTTDVLPAMARETAAAVVEPDERAAVLPDRTEAIEAPPADAVAVYPAPVDTAAQAPFVPADPSRDDRALETVEATSGPMRQAAPSDVVPAQQVQPANAADSTVAAPAVDAPVRLEKEPVAHAADFVDAVPTVPKDEDAAAVADDGSLEPIDVARLVTAEEVVTAPPLPRENPLEVVKAKPKTTTASVAPRASAASSAASPAARGPAKAKAKAGAGGKAKAVRGTADLSSYQSKLVSHLRRFRTYPAAARRQRLEGTASIRVTINRSGRVTAVSLAKSSGHGILDREAVAMAKRASPFPPLPTGLGRSQITIRAPIRFDVR